LLSPCCSVHRVNSGRPSCGARIRSMTDLGVWARLDRPERASVVGRLRASNPPSAIDGSRRGADPGRTD
jgi:predicted Fe-S protein YdhL (DUF1289 family)